MLKNFVNNMIKLERYDDLLDLLTQESPYTTDSVSNIPKAREEIEQYSYAVDHIRFLKKFGHTDELMIDKDGRAYRWNIDYFDKWLENGVKGLEENEVESYLKDYPFP
ncbi:hypothetical protein NDN13_03355 [Acinetobacter sp. C32I]|uniref:hypothetical protein n=1 Tax=Acinetobacter sp. C32I TaxID=2950074 RepID=UPI0020373BA9|nr:hypothetical protein [Acinetobacter sp. C32I]USA54243.1 hypothetical protein NDN13_03355 [Acinetobacter sp. C32I]